MTPVLDFLLLLVCHLMLLFVAAGDGNGDRGECPASFECGYLGNISFPFTTTERPDCGLLSIQNCNEIVQPKRIQLQNKGKWFYVILKHHVSNTSSSIHIRDDDFYRLLQSRSCEAFSRNYTLPPPFHFASFSIEYNATLFRCNRSLHVSTPKQYVFNYTGCPDYDLYYTFPIAEEYLPSSLAACTKVQLPIKDVPDANDPFTFVNADITIQVHLSEECANCHYQKRGLCQLDSQSKFYCANWKPQENRETQAHPSESLLLSAYRLIGSSMFPYKFVKHCLLYCKMPRAQFLAPIS